MSDNSSLDKCHTSAFSALVSVANIKVKGYKFCSAALSH